MGNDTTQAPAARARSKRAPRTAKAKPATTGGRRPPRTPGTLRTAKARSRRTTMSATSEHEHETRTVGSAQALRERIAARAHELYEGRGAASRAGALDDWLQAEAEILGAATAVEA
jgi:hypothetical protein